MVENKLYYKIPAINNNGLPQFKSQVELLENLKPEKQMIYHR